MGIPLGLCQCGCGGKTTLAKETRRKQNIVKGEPNRFIVGHRKGKPYRSDISSFYFVDKNSGCWIWKGKKNEDGYGLIRKSTTVASSYYMAHRYVYELHHGVISEGLQLDHVTCKTPSCVNPDHLEPVTQTVNVQRGGCAKLTPEQVLEIRALGEQMSCKELADRFGITHHQVRKIIKKRAWKNL